MLKLKCCHSYTGDRKEVHHMEYIIAFLISVMAGIISYYICKWLDEDT